MQRNYGKRMVDILADETHFAQHAATFKELSYTEQRGLIEGWFEITRYTPDQPPIRPEWRHAPMQVEANGEHELEVHPQFSRFWEGRNREEWTQLFRFLNEAYTLGMTDGDCTMFGHAYAEQFQYTRRGGDNPYILEIHEDNNAIHSVLSGLWSADIFRAAKVEDPEHRKEMFLRAFVHDLGEFNGELQGATGKFFGVQVENKDQIEHDTMLAVLNDYRARQETVDPASGQTVSLLFSRTLEEWDHLHHTSAPDKANPTFDQVFFKLIDRTEGGMRYQRYFLTNTAFNRDVLHKNPPLLENHPEALTKLSINREQGSITVRPFEVASNKSAKEEIPYREKYYAELIHQAHLTDAADATEDNACLAAKLIQRAAQGHLLLSVKLGPAFYTGMIESAQGHTPECRQMLNEMHTWMHEHHPKESSPTYVQEMIHFQKSLLIKCHEIESRGIEHLCHDIPIQTPDKVYDRQFKIMQAAAHKDLTQIGTI